MYLIGHFHTLVYQSDQWDELGVCWYQWLPSLRSTEELVMNIREGKVTMRDELVIIGCELGEVIL